MGEKPIPREEALLAMFSKRLRKAREQAGYDTAADFARILGLNTATYRTYENGRIPPHLACLQDIAEYTGTSLDWLLLGHGAASGKPSAPSLAERVAELEKRVKKLER